MGWIEEMHPKRAVPVVTGYAQNPRAPGVCRAWLERARAARSRRASSPPCAWCCLPLAVGAALIVLPLIGFIVWRHPAVAHGLEKVRRKRGAARHLRCAASAMASLRLIIPGARVRLLNPVAEDLTGWSEAEARGRPLGRSTAHSSKAKRGGGLENPFSRVLREESTVALGDRRLLIARDGTKTRHCGPAGADSRRLRGRSTAWCSSCAMSRIASCRSGRSARARKCFV
jgi:PAS domain-containing protein